MWVSLPDLPYKVVNHQMVFMNDELIIFGGYKNTEAMQYVNISVTIFRSTDSSYVHLTGIPTYVLNVNNNEITKSDIVVEPIDCYGHTVIKWNDSAVLFGGCFCVGHCQSNIFLFIKRGHQFFPVDYFEKDYVWIKIYGVKGDIPMKRDGHAVAIYRNCMYLYGGLVENQYNTTIKYYDNKLYQLNLIHWKWKILYDGEYIEPLSRDFCSLVAYNNALYMYGGRSDQSLGSLRYNDNYDSAVWKFELIRFRDDLPNKWIKVQNGCGIVRNTIIEAQNGNINNSSLQNSVFPIPRRSHMTVLIKNELIIIGGLYETHLFNIHFKDVWSFNLDTSKWTCLSYSSPQLLPVEFVPLRRAACVRIGSQCGIVISGGVSIQDVAVSQPAFNEQMMDLNQMSLFYDFKVESIMIDSDLQYNNIENVFEQTIDDLTTQIDLIQFDRNKTIFSGILFNTNTTSRPILHSTNRIYFFQPFVSLYERAMSQVINNYPHFKSHTNQLPTKILKDLRKMKIFC